MSCESENFKAIVFIIIIIIIIIIITLITFIQIISDHIPETHHVSGVRSVVASLLYLQFVLHEILFRRLHTFCTCICTLKISVQCSIWLILVVP